MTIPRYLARRVLLGAAQIPLVMIIVFFLTEALPGDAAVTIAGDNPDPAVIALLREQLGLNEPAWQRLGGWLVGALHGDFGQSLVGPRSVADIIGSAAGPTLLLATLTLALLIPVSVALGVLAANREGSRVDRLITSGTVGLYSVPEFAMGILLVTVFAVRLGWLPPTAVGSSSLLASPAVLVLPVIVLLLRPLCSLSRLIRAGMIDALRSDYVQHVRRVGLSAVRVQFAHALPNAVAPAVQQLARTADWLIGGVIVVEAIFVVPGLGTTLVEAISARNLPVIQGLAVVFATTAVLVNLAADVAARLLAPRLGGRPMTRYAVALVLIGVPIVLALFGPLFAAEDTAKEVPFTLGDGHWFGTDFLGRDVWNEVLLGGRSLVLVAALATVFTYLLAVPLGLVAGMTRNRALDEVIMRPLDVVLAIPSMLMLLLLASIRPDVMWVLIAVVALTNLPDVVRISRAAALSLSSRPAVEAMLLQGESRVRIGLGYVARAMTRLLAADLGTRFTGAVYLVASASFLGVGVPPGSSDWAAMVDRNRAGLFLQPWAVVLPALLIVMLTVGVNLAFDRWLRDRDQFASTASAAVDSRLEAAR